MIVSFLIVYYYVLQIQSTSSRHYDLSTIRDDSRFANKSRRTIIQDLLGSDVRIFEGCWIERPRSILME